MWYYVWKSYVIYEQTQHIKYTNFLSAGAEENHVPNTLLYVYDPISTI